MAQTFIVKYDANGGSGAPPAQTKIAGQNLTLSSVRPTKYGFNFSHWKSSAQGNTYSPGSLYGYDASTTMVAQWTPKTFTISYNANGGTGAPGSQTKYFGTTLVVSSTIPTRNGFTFLGWSTSSMATVAEYQPGSNLLVNASIVLYAIWKSSYTKPRIKELVAYRSADGKTEKSDATNIRLGCSWETDLADPTIVISWAPATGSGNSRSITISGGYTSGILIEYLRNYDFSVEQSYDITVTVTDGNGSTSETVTVNGVFTMELLAGGKGVAFGKPAETENAIDVAWNLLMNGNRIDNFTIVPELVKVTAAGETNTKLLAILNAMPAGSIKHVLLYLSGVADVLPSTGYWLVTIYRTAVFGASTAYGVMKAIKQNQSSPANVNFHEASCSIFNGTMSTWQRTALDAYPVGAYYIANNGQSPAAMFGGSWYRVEGRFLYGCATTGTIGGTGSHTTGTGNSTLPYVNVALWRRTE